MRGSNESTPLDCSETGADRQFVDLPLFTDLESEEAGARETDKAAKPLESEPEATGPIRSAPQESSPAVATPVVQEPEALELDLEEADVDDEEELEPQPYEGPASLMTDGAPGPRMLIIRAAC